jgi:c-di-GMP-binding flagellar brake protein YcgR
VGSVSAVGGAPVGGPLGTVDALRFQYRGAPEKVFRRAYVRTDYVARVFLFAEAAPERPLPCVTMNVSGGGLLLRGVPGDPASGDELRFTLELGAAVPRMVGACRIVRRTPEGFIGVQFTEIADADRERLIGFAEQRERVSRLSRGGV